MIVGIIIIIFFSNHGHPFDFKKKGHPSGQKKFIQVSHLKGHKTFTLCINASN